MLKVNLNNNEILLNEEQIGVITVKLVQDKTKNLNIHSYLDKQEDELIKWGYFEILHGIDYGKQIPISDFAIIDHIKINKIYRSKGIGTDAIKQLIFLLKNRNYEYIFVYPYPLIEDSIEIYNEQYNKLIKFYEKLGFSKAIAIKKYKYPYYILKL